MIFSTLIASQKEIKIPVERDESESESPPVMDPMDSSPPGSSAHGILQARILEWVAIFFSREYPWSRDQTFVYCVSSIADRFFTHWAIGEDPYIVWFHLYQFKGQMKLTHGR